MRSSRAKAKGTFAFPLLHTGLLRPNRSQWSLTTRLLLASWPGRRNALIRSSSPQRPFPKIVCTTAFRDIRFRVMPEGQQFKPRDGNFTVLNAIEEVPEHRGRQIVSGNPGHGS